MRKLLFVGIMITLLLRSVFAQSNETKLMASDSAIFDLFGVSVSINGDYAIIGAREGIFNSGPGKAYVFRRSNGVWLEHSILSPSDGVNNDLFGASVSIDGEYVAIGSPRYDQTKGAVYIFNREGEIWREQAKLLANDGELGDVFGSSVSISGDYVCIGAYLDNNNETDAGSAYVFRRAAGSRWEQQVKLTPSNEFTAGQFGYSVSIDENRVLVGGFFDAYLFERVNFEWLERERLLPDGNLAGSFGTTVSLSGDYAIIGKFSDDNIAINSGSAFIFMYDGRNWTQQVKLKASDATFVDWFGYSVAISNDLAIVGAPADRNNSNSAGKAYIFRRNGENWIEQAKLLASDGMSRDQFGNAVSINHGKAIVGAITDGGFQGSAYVFNDVTVGIEDLDNYFIPSGFTLHQNYPNPFNPSTKIRYGLPETAQVKLEIFNAIGQRMATLVDERQSAGFHEFEFDASGLASGVYLYRIQAGSFVQMKKMVYLR